MENFKFVVQKLLSLEWVKSFLSMWPIHGGVSATCTNWNGCINLMFFSLGIISINISRDCAHWCGQNRDIKSLHYLFPGCVAGLLRLVCAAAVAPPVPRLRVFVEARPPPLMRPSTPSFGVAALLLERLLGWEEAGVDVPDTATAVDGFQRPAPERNNQFRIQPKIRLIAWLVYFFI